MGKIAPNLSLKQALKQVVCAEQQMHDISEFEVSMPEEGTICIRFSNCDRYRRQKETVKRMDLKIEPRDICEVERLHHFHPRHPMQDAGVTPIDVKGKTPDACGPLKGNEVIGFKDSRGKGFQ